MLNDDQLLTEEASRELIKRASVLACECPRHLVNILRAVREFEIYERGCVNRSPQDRETHEWLYMAARNLDQMLSSTIVQLARLEGMIDDGNRFVDHPHHKG